MTIGMPVFPKGGGEGHFRSKQIFCRFFSLSKCPNGGGGSLPIPKQWMQIYAYLTKIATQFPETRAGGVKGAFRVGGLP